jgi:hypothetical protein
MSFYSSSPDTVLRGSHREHFDGAPFSGDELVPGFFDSWLALIIPGNLSPLAYSLIAIQNKLQPG